MSGCASKVETSADRPKPPNAGKGRKKGVPNKVTADVKAMILTALDRAGGVDYLVTQAASNPSAFLTLVGKVLPKELVGKDGEALPPATIVINPVTPRGE